MREREDAKKKKIPPPSATHQMCDLRQGQREGIQVHSCSSMGVSAVALDGLALPQRPGRLADGEGAGRQKKRGEGEKRRKEGEIRREKKKRGDAGDEIGPPKTGASSAPRGRRGGPGRERTGGVEASKPGLRRVRSFLCVNDPGETSDFLFFAFYGRPEKEELVTARGSDRLGVFVSTRLFCVFFIIQVLHWLPSFHAGITARILAS